MSVLFIAQEGIDFLKAEGKQKLFEFQGLAPPAEASKPAVPWDTTMAVTAKVSDSERLSIFKSWKCNHSCDLLHFSITQHWSCDGAHQCIVP
jgi:hypothetical protein